MPNKRRAGLKLMGAYFEEETVEDFQALAESIGASKAVLLREAVAAVLQDADLVASVRIEAESGA